MAPISPTAWNGIVLGQFGFLEYLNQYLPYVQLKYPLVNVYSPSTYSATNIVAIVEAGFCHFKSQGDDEPESVAEITDVASSLI